MLSLTAVQTAWALASGGAVGFALALVGGGGSILAVPALLYLVGLADTHLAIGTSALAVSVNAFANLAMHASKQPVKWRCAAVYAASGVLGAVVGSTLGKLVDGRQLLLYFAVAMVAVGIAMLRPKAAGGNPDVQLNLRILPKLAILGLLTGLASGFFGIGGGFLVVPGLMAGSGMPMLNAVAASLLSVGSFGLTTATNYAISNQVHWIAAGWFIGGGLLGGFLGLRLARRAAQRKGLLNRIFAGLIFVVAAYIVWRAL